MRLQRGVQRVRWTVRPLFALEPVDHRGHDHVGRGRASRRSADAVACQEVVVRVSRAARRSDGRARVHEVLRARVQRGELALLFGVSTGQERAQVADFRFGTENLQVKTSSSRNNTNNPYNCYILWDISFSQREHLSPEAGAEVNVNDSTRNKIIKKLDNPPR